MTLSHAGLVAHLLWQQIPYHTKNKIWLGSFCIMPNHLHGIIQLNQFHHSKECSAATDKNSNFRKITPKQNSISTIIRSYKSAVTKTCNQLGYPMQWHNRFYDHIIKDQEAFHNIDDYIKNNPQKWAQDKFHS
ncbi:hypothetical protein PEPS_09050 [Persicobacter psychrovividus]|uniref:Transposase IS200-like domain-containing protein n=2 Tax=Persicobacter psychrovividus TaxID=387638 RepID=A0ABM7VCH1_9BACT|nr:hypothetical protein PEPS_09050 [Persicobacter psychrovividus]